MFHSSRIHGDKQPGWFTQGIREAIRGWDRSLRDMCAGEKRSCSGLWQRGKRASSFMEISSVTSEFLRRKFALVKEHLRKEFELNGQPPNDTLHQQILDNILKKGQNKDGFLSSREFTYKHDQL